jgi:hypothetical protein
MSQILIFIHQWKFKWKLKTLEFIRNFFCRNVVFVLQQKKMNWYVEAHEGKAWNKTVDDKNELVTVTVNFN